MHTALVENIGNVFRRWIALDGFSYYFLILFLACAATAAFFMVRHSCRLCHTRTEKTLIAFWIFSGTAALCLSTYKSLPSMFSADDSAEVRERRLETCLNLKPGVTEAQLLSAMGKPVDILRHGSWTTYLFSAPDRTAHSKAASFIRAEVDTKSNMIFELWCKDEFKPLWETPEQFHGTKIDLDRRRTPGKGHGFSPSEIISFILLIPGFFMPLVALYGRGAGTIHSGPIWFGDSQHVVCKGKFDFDHSAGTMIILGSLLFITGCFLLIQPLFGD